MKTKLDAREAAEAALDQLLADCTNYSITGAIERAFRIGFDAGRKVERSAKRPKRRSAVILRLVPKS